MCGASIQFVQFVTRSVEVATISHAFSDISALTDSNSKPGEVQKSAILLLISMFDAVNDYVRIYMIMHEYS